MNNNVKVIKSPTKWDLIISVAERKTIVIGTSIGDLRVQILGLEQEDGSCQSWNIRGYIVQNNNRFNGYLRTDQNSGYLKIHND